MSSTHRGGKLASLVFEKNVVPRVLNVRPQPKLVYCDPDYDDDQPKGFTAKPADDIPRNRLV